VPGKPPIVTKLGDRRPNTGYNYRLMKNLYVVSISATQTKNSSWTYNYSAVIPVTASYERAEESGMMKALELWPTQDGWSNHGVKAALVTDAANISNRLLEEDDDEEVTFIM